MYHDVNHEQQARVESYLDSLDLNQGIASLQLDQAQNDNVSDDERAEAPALVAADASAEEDDGWTVVKK